MWLWTTVYMMNKLPYNPAVGQAQGMKKEGLELNENASDNLHDPIDANITL